MFKLPFFFFIKIRIFHQIIKIKKTINFKRSYYVFSIVYFYDGDQSGLNDFHLMVMGKMLV